MTYDLTKWTDRDDYARNVEDAGPLKPAPEHLTLLASACWSWNDAEFGAASISPKHPYGNSDVEDDLAELLPHLSPENRLKRHCELPAVLAYIASKATEIAW